MRDNWNFNASNPMVYAGGNYNRNTNHGMFYLNYNAVTTSNANLGCRPLLEKVRLTVRQNAQDSAQLLLEISR